MAISFSCPCGKRLRTKDEHAGKRTKCPACGEGLVVPIPEPHGESDDDYALMPAPTFGPFAGSTAPPPPRMQEEPSSYIAARAGMSKPSPAPRLESEASSGTSLREYMYWLLLLAFVPLGFSMLHKEDDFKDRLHRTIAKNIESVKGVITEEGVEKDKLLAALPEKRIEGAHLPVDTWMHWVYATIAAAGFFGVTMLIFPPGAAKPSHLLAVGLFTGTLGIVFLLGVQFIADFTQGFWVRGRGIITLVFYILKFIGFSYRAALDPENGFLLSFLGFTCGVGLCEELCKALPLVVHFHRDPSLGWRGACLWGLASGVGFGISEGIMYASNHYNGVSPVDIYFIRFISCVGLHAVWSASVGITIYRCQDMLQGAEDFGAWGVALLRVVAVPMVLHGLYDTLLKQDHNVWALLVGLVSFGWLAWQIEHARGNEPVSNRTSRARAAY